FRTGDVVVQPRAIRPDRIEERDALRAVLHRMSDESNRIANLVARACPALPRHDVDRTALDVPSADRLWVDPRRRLDVDGEVDVRVLPLPFRNDALILDVLVHLEHREGMVCRDGRGHEYQTDNGKAGACTGLHANLHSDAEFAFIS